MAIFELYRSKLHPACDALWQHPRRGPVNYTDPVWFENKKIGHNPLETFMKKLCEEAELENKRYTNHSIRATCISRLDSSGFEARHITAISSHKSESTIWEYSVKCPENKRKEMFKALANTLAPPNQPPTKKIKKEPTATVSSESALVPKQNTEQYSTINFPDLNNCDLLPLDPEKDALLSKILTQTEKDLGIDCGQSENTPPEDTPPPPPPNQNTSLSVQNTLKQSSTPMAPRMYFSNNANVTINYNFITK